jgi:signal transduction histidine kinase
VEIAVCDNGPGVAADITPRLFDPFCTTKKHGTGLGLASSRTIVKAHQGALDYAPNVPQGACFSVRLPAVKSG